ncbi:hypothetical protein MASR2M39_13880 [Ignavibacteriales bacterium]
MNTALLLVLAVINLGFLLFFYIKILSKKSPEKIAVSIPESIIEKTVSPAEMTETASQTPSIYNQLLISLFERSSLGIVLFDQKGSILALNNSFKEILELSDDTSEIVYFNDLSLLFPTLFSDEKKSNRDFIAYSSYDCRLEINGREKFLRVNYYSHEVPDSESALIVQISDYTIYKKFELELINSKEEAENLNKMKSIFLANMSHEIRTPMNGIIGFSGLLREDVTEPNHIEMADRVYKSSIRLMETLESVLDLSKLEAEHQYIENNPVDINTVVNQVYHNYFDFVKEKNLKFTCDTPDHPVPLELDESILAKILKQLLSNAVKFTATGGIFLKVEEEIHNNNRVVIISVEDTGIGISLKNQEIIFEEFRQVSEGIGRNYEGVGIGLTIVKRFCEMINAKISIKSSPNSGSKFTLRFLDKTADHLSDNEEIADLLSEKKLLKKKILVVEDDFTNKELINIYLSEQYNLVFASSAIEALKAIDKDKFDLCLIDINLGSKPNGIELLGLILKKSEKPPIAIAMTAYYLNKTEKECLDAGFNFFISKPLKRKKLLETIDGFLLS